MTVVSIRSIEICCEHCNHEFREDIPTGYKAVQCPNCNWWINEHGNIVSKHHCKACNRDFVCCPPIPMGTPGWDCCLAEDCSSYDPNRNADKYFGAD